MIGRLKGLVEWVGTDHLILDVSGVGYLVYADQQVIAQAVPGLALELWIETHVREDHIHLYGFATRAAQSWFRLLITVQGVGVRMAQAMLGMYSPEQLHVAIAAQDKAMLTAISGVGPKLADRIITELKNKVAEMPTHDESQMMPAHSGGQVTPIVSAPKAGAAHSEAEDAISALVHLGYGRAEAHQAVMRASANGSEGLDALIRLALQELAA